MYCACNNVIENGCVCMLSYGCRSWAKVCLAGCSGCSEALRKTRLFSSPLWLNPFSNKPFCNIRCRMITQLLHLVFFFFFFYLIIKQSSNTEKKSLPYSISLIFNSVPHVCTLIASLPLPLINNT